MVAKVDGNDNDITTLNAKLDQEIIDRKAGDQVNENKFTVFIENDLEPDDVDILDISYFVDPDHLPTYAGN